MGKQEEFSFSFSKPNAEKPAQASEESIPKIEINPKEQESLKLDEFRGMSVAELRQNIEDQEERIQLRRVDPNEIPEIEGLIKRMKARVEKEEQESKETA